MTPTIPSGFPSRLYRWLNLTQAALLLAVGVLGVISAPRMELLLVTEFGSIPREFQSINLSIADVLMIGLLAVSGMRLVVDSGYRARLSATVNRVVGSLGGTWWALLALWMTASTIWAREAALARFDALHMIAALLMGLLLAEAVRERGYRLFLLALVVNAVFQSSIAILQVLNRNPLGLWALGEIERFVYDTTPYYRAPGLAMHPNYLGGYLMAALVGCLLLARTTGGRRALLVYAAAGGVVLLGLVGTLSRSAMVGTAAGLVAVLKPPPPNPLPTTWRGGAESRAAETGNRFALRGGNSRRRWIVVGGLLVVAVLGLWGWTAMEGNIQNRLFSGREFFLTDTLAVIEQTPILGTGAGNLMVEIGQTRGNVIDRVLPVHNVYLFVWAELGLPGLALFLLGMMALLRGLRPGRRMAVLADANPHPPPPSPYNGEGEKNAGSLIGAEDSPKALLMMWSSALVAVGVVMLFDNYWWAIHPFRAFFFWMIGLWWGIASRDES